MSRRYRINYENTSLEAPEGELLVGRSPECHLVLDDPSVSRVHCAFVLENGVLYAEDRGSRNGVTVNGKLISKRTPLKDGYTVSVGRQKISIVSLVSESHSEHTQGLRRCVSCGSWVPSASTDCESCGTRFRVPRAKRGTLALKKTRGDYPADQAPNKGHQKSSSVIERHPIVMLTELALKSLKVQKNDEAMRLISNAIASANDRIDREGNISDDEFQSVVRGLLIIAESERASHLISELFAFHLRASRLVSREHVEKLYDIVRPAGYRICSNMNRYLAYLDRVETQFSPGERFIHKRVRGLVKLCS